MLCRRREVLADCSLQGNILMNDKGVVQLTDFGLSLIADATSYNYASHHGGGAIAWTAPELLDPDRYGLTTRRATLSSDVYSFGCICVEVCYYIVDDGVIDNRVTSSVVHANHALQRVRPTAAPDTPSRRRRSPAVPTQTSKWNTHVR